jgi:hypothetical protein
MLLKHNRFFRASLLLGLREYVVNRLIAYGSLQCDYDRVIHRKGINMRTDLAKVKRLIKAAFPVIALAAFLFLLFVALTRAQEPGACGKGFGTTELFSD